jgi:hypothetical protein
LRFAHSIPVHGVNPAIRTGQPAVEIAHSGIAEQHAQRDDYGRPEQRRESLVHCHQTQVSHVPLSWFGVVAGRY